jgi:hypothetical protein
LYELRPESATFGFEENNEGSVGAAKCLVVQ